MSRGYPSSGRKVTDLRNPPRGPAEQVEPVAWLCQYDGSVHRRGIHHRGDTPLVPAKPSKPPAKPGESA